MVNDRELLEDSAKAAGLKIEYWAHDDYPVVSNGAENFGWNPLKFDSDAFRLAVNLGLVVDCSRPSAGQPFRQHAICFDDAMSNAELTRRAIVQAAAEIGKTA